VVKDDLTNIFKKVEGADGLVFGSPIYLGSITGEMQSFLERLVFPYLTYTDPPETLFTKKIRTGFIYTMGLPEQMVKEVGYEHNFANTARFLGRIFGASETLMCFDTYQFKEYSKYVATRFDPEAKLKRRQEVFPKDCQKALEMGKRLAGN
jgi:multimeric flavodoxin WrbA